jgi:hypothetical protein
MEQNIELPVEYNGKEMIIDGRLVSFGYSYKLYMMINETEIIFEKDDSQQYRALIEKDGSSKHVDSGLINAVIAVLNSL